MAIDIKGNSRKKAVWLSYDLGLRGDYAGLYAWLDKNGARECGDTTAFLELEFSGNIVEWLKEDLQRHLTIAPKDRIYVIYLDRVTTKIKGKFIFGSRRKPIWDGYGQVQSEEDVEDS